MAGNLVVREPIGSHGQLSGLSSVKPLSIPTDADGVVLQATGNDVRFTMDGSDPTAEKGFRLVASQTPLFIQIGSDIDFRFIEEAASAILEYQWIE